MTQPTPRFLMPRSVRFGLAVATLAALGTGAIVWYQVRHEYQSSVEDLDRRAAALIFRSTPAAQEALSLPDAQVGAAMGDRLDGHSRLLGLALFRPDGRLIASGQSVTDFEPTLAPIVGLISQAVPNSQQVVRNEAGTTHVLATAIAGADGQP